MKVIAKNTIDYWLYCWL